MPTQQEKALQFKQLHEQPGCFVIPNPWDIGSARLLEGLGFKALATTSSGFANSLGRLDGEISLEEKLAHCRLLAAAAEIPISADLENCFADDPEAAANTIGLAAETGIVGGSIEDYSGTEIYDFSLAVERVAAAVEASQRLPFPFGLTARAENLIRGVNDLDDTIRRLQAFEAAGADVLYAPGLRTIDEIKLVIAEINRPLNVLVTMMSDPDVTVDELQAAGVKRISIGGGLFKAAYDALLQTGYEMVEQKTFQWRSQLSHAKELNRFLNR